MDNQLLKYSLGGDFGVVQAGKFRTFVQLIFSMSSTLPENSQASPVSQMAAHLIGSEIIRLANDINERIKAGESIDNFTIGDFDPAVFPVPDELLEEIVKAYRNGHTNYPVANGAIELRRAIVSYVADTQHLTYSPDEILVAGGARPLIYAVYTTLIDPGDEVIYPVPSWNNNHYCHLTGAKGIQIQANEENNFMPVAADIAPHLKTARMVALCSPQNPTGTVFTKKQLQDICDLVLAENKRRGPNERPLYIMYDQIYAALSYGDNKHYDPVTLCPELRPYTVFVDGLSKTFAATGVRVGWSFGPPYIIERMKSILSHIGAWAPKAEQIASAAFLNDKSAVNAFLTHFKKELTDRLHGFYNIIGELAAEGHPVKCIEPVAAIYLTVQFDLKGKITPGGKVLQSTEDITAYILDQAKLAIVPFYAFGAPRTSTWYRMSVGTCRTADLPGIAVRLRNALNQLRSA